MSNQELIDKFRQQIRKKHKPMTTNYEQDNLDESDKVVELNNAQVANSAEDIHPEYAIKNHNNVNLPTDQPMPILDYVFVPKEDINLQELTRLLAFLFMSVSKETYEKMPLELQKHFIKYES